MEPNFAIFQMISIPFHGHLQMFMSVSSIHFLDHAHSLFVTVVTNRILEITILWNVILSSTINAWYQLLSWDGDFLNAHCQFPWAFTFCSADSMVCANSKVFANVRSFSAINCCCVHVLSLQMPQKSWSLNASPKNALNSYVMGSHYNSVA